MPRSRRSPNRITDGQLVDDAGNEWHLVDKELSRHDIARLLADPDVRVGVRAQRALVQWVPPEAREHIWNEVVEPNFHDRAAKPDGPRPFHGTRWRRRGKDVLLFDDFD